MFKEEEDKDGRARVTASEERLLRPGKSDKVIQVLENVAIANALQLEAARACTPLLFRFNYDVMPNLTSLNLSIAVL